MGVAGFFTSIQEVAFHLCILCNSICPLDVVKSSETTSVITASDGAFGKVVKSVWNDADCWCWESSPRC